MGAIIETPTSMATATTITTNTKHQPMRVCFSFAAYSKNLINHLKTNNGIPIQQGLTEPEFAEIESSLNFSFPPDLRSILREGLPIGPGFPNWRSSSRPQLEIITNMPKLGISREVVANNLWFENWGTRPKNRNDALSLSNRFLKSVPVLVPIYKNFYISSYPNMAGNPVFYVKGSDVRVMSYDLTGFFMKVEDGAFRFVKGWPVWAATAARRVEFWSDMAAREGCTHGWWSGTLGSCMENVYWKLRDGGWNEEEIRDMMMTSTAAECGSERGDLNSSSDNSTGFYGVEKRELMSVLSLKLIDGGWSKDDALDSLGLDCLTCDEDVADGNTFVDFQVS